MNKANRQLVSSASYLLTYNLAVILSVHRLLINTVNDNLLNYRFAEIIMSHRSFGMSETLMYMLI